MNTYSASGTKPWWEQREKIHSTTLKQLCLRNDITPHPQGLVWDFEKRQSESCNRKSLMKEGGTEGKMNTEPKKPKTKTQAKLSDRSWVLPTSIHHFYGQCKQPVCPHGSWTFNICHYGNNIWQWLLGLDNSFFLIPFMVSDEEVL